MIVFHDLTGKKNYENFTILIWQNLKGFEDFQFLFEILRNLHCFIVFRIFFEIQKLSIISYRDNTFTNVQFFHVQKNKPKKNDMFGIFFEKMKNYEMDGFVNVCQDDCKSSFSEWGSSMSLNGWDRLKSL